MCGVDPFAILGVEPDVSEHELTAAYRRLAKRWHPDRHAGGERRMAALNAAYERARAELRRAEGTTRTYEPTIGRRPAPGTWLPPGLRERLGWELLAALAENEHVRLVVDAGGAARGPVRLVLTDSRLLWLLEDAVSARVDWIRFGLVAAAEIRRPMMRRSRRSLHVHTKNGRHVVFGDLDPQSADTIVERLGTR